MEIISIIISSASLIIASMTLYLVFSAHRRETRREFKDIIKEEKETIKEGQKFENLCPELSKFQRID